MLPVDAVDQWQALGRLVKGTVITVALAPHPVSVSHARSVHTGPELIRNIDPCWARAIPASGSLTLLAQMVLTTPWSAFSPGASASRAALRAPSAVRTRPGSWMR